jgi:dihydrofolate synthase/folylpolyglutamate synthase
MTAEETIAFFCRADWKKCRPGLERIRMLMHFLGDPQDTLRFIHVAGTNGKGSVCAMLASVLQESGYVTGLYTSPHLQRMNERIQVNGTRIPDQAMDALAQRIQEAASRMTEPPTEFEILTAMAFLWFYEQKCEIVVLEVGLGGRLDATNLIPSPEVAAICTIGLDHTSVLGETREKIAAEKAGIIKPGCHVVLAAQGDPVERVIEECCALCGDALTITEPVRVLSAGLDGQLLCYRNRGSLCLSLTGTYQARNAAVALDTLDALRGRGWNISEAAVSAGFQKVFWPGRFQILRRKPLIILDGAHNPDGVEELAACLASLLPDRRLMILLGVLSDKDYRRMIRLIAPHAACFLAAEPRSERALPSVVLAKVIAEETGLPVTDVGTVEAGLEMILDRCGPEDAACVFGSLYQAGAVLTWFEAQNGLLGVR